MPLLQSAIFALAVADGVHSCRFPLSRPAVALMFIDDTHCLHERMANGRSDETETPSSEILAHRVALRRRLGNAAQIQGPAAQHLAVRELPDVAVEGAQGGADLEVGLGVGNEGLH